MNTLIGRLSKDIRYKTFAHCNEGGFFDGVAVAANNPAATSLRFTGEPEEAVRRAFGIQNPAFHDMFLQACSGDIRERGRISTLHSSSLLTLLFFSSVSRDNPIFLDDEQDRRIQFTSVTFREKLTIPNNVRATDTDVALRGDGHNITLFLESKYSEYLHTGDSTCISGRVYGDIYRRLEPTLADMGFRIQRNGYCDAFDLCAASFAKMHTGGIRQLISHWLGSAQYARMHTSEEVWLGETVYDFGDDTMDALKKYSRDVRMLSKALNRMDDTPGNLHMMPLLLTFQEIISENPQFMIPERAALYYNF